VLQRGPDDHHSGPPDSGFPLVEATQPVRGLTAGDDEQVRADGSPVQVHRPEPETALVDQPASGRREHSLDTRVEHPGPAALPPPRPVKLGERP
jgi:hypothetical protein